jgi:hypothetical protein
MSITVFSEIKSVIINTECIENPVCLRWLNSLGGFDTWVFGRRQIKTLEVSNSNYVKKYQTDLSLGNPIRNIQKKALKSIILGVDNLDKSYSDGLFELATSPLIEMLTNPDTWESEGAKFMQVFIKDDTFETEDTSIEQFSCEFEIILPEIITQSYV